MNNDLIGALKVLNRDGSLAPFDPQRIAIAIKKAYIDVHGAHGGQAMEDLISACVDEVISSLTRTERVAAHIEDIQDAVELALMRRDPRLAKGYILYRQEHAKLRQQAATPAAPSQLMIMVDGQPTPFDAKKVVEDVLAVCEGLDVDAHALVERASKEIFNGATAEDVGKALRMAARPMIERDPVYDRVVARLTLSDLYREVLQRPVSVQNHASAATAAFPDLIRTGVDAGLLDKRMASFDLPRLAGELKTARDFQFDSLGLQTLYDRYFLHVEGRRIEVPQTFFMRVAMGLALNEEDREARAIEFYNLLSSFDFMNSTPTLFNSGAVRSQLASCYLTTIGDDLDSIYMGIHENAMLQKFAGGLGNDWTPVRALGSHIKGTNGKSQGVVPFLKVVNDTAVAVNQGGKRKGAVCAYLETWHLDIEEFLELRKNTGDDRRRTHDMNTANWIPDLFMKRVMEKGPWTLFSPDSVPDLHDLYGKPFELRYTEYEAAAQRGEIKPSKTIPAVDLWRRMLTMLFETGHPWLTFKDPCNIRNPQQHVGVVHSSNLCTEITLNTSASETAVCNIGSVNLMNHITNGKLDRDKLRATVRTAMRMLDNVIDLNHYSVEKARTSNMRHRPVGIGMMGFHDALQVLGYPYASDEALQFADTSTELLCFEAYSASSDLALERGSYGTFEGSLWSQGILPIDTIDMLAEARGERYVQVDRSSTLGAEAWGELRLRIKRNGMRNSNCVAIAPTATIGNIVAVSASIDPLYSNLSVKSNLSGEFTLINERLVSELKKLGLWDAAMLADLKHYDGSLARISRIPEILKRLYATAFEIDPSWLIEAAARRQKWIDQAQSLNIYMAGASGKKLDETYKLAWQRGLKTTYYLRTISASSAEKSTVSKAGQLNSVSSGAPAMVSAATVPDMPDAEGAVCMMRPGDPGFEECEACQ